jgi:mono/diheme cytochrome c family protein
MEGAGKKLFMEHCASCHGVNAKGKGPASSALNAPPPDLTQIAEKRGGVFPDAEISRFVDGRMDIAAHGNREMPIWGRALQGNYAAGEIAESAVQGKIAVLIEYLKSIQQ